MNEKYINNFFFEIKSLVIMKNKTKIKIVQLT